MFSILCQELQHSKWLCSQHLLSLWSKNYTSYKLGCEKTLKVPLKHSARLYLDLPLSPFLDFRTNASLAVLQSLVSSFTRCIVLSLCCSKLFHTVTASFQALFATQCLFLFTSINHLFMLPTGKEVQMHLCS